MIFLSYSSKDLEFVENILSELRSSIKEEIWFGKEKINLGDSWRYMFFTCSDTTLGNWNSLQSAHSVKINRNKTCINSNRFLSLRRKKYSSKR